MNISHQHLNIIKAMESNKKTRFITIGTPTIKFKNDKKSIGTTFVPLIIRLLLPRAAREMRAIGNIQT